jgi:hypothetical protein
MVCLALALLVACSVALPITRLQDGRRKIGKRQVADFLFSHNTGFPLHLYPDGNVTATYAQGANIGMFFLREGSSRTDSMFRHNLSLTSVDQNGSYLHFVQLVPVEMPRADNNATLNATLNETDVHVNDDIDSANETTLSVEVVETFPVVFLVLDDINGEDEAGMIRHHMWTEERIPHGSSVLYRYSVMLADGKVCYLAFEGDGVPVKNPCLSHEELEAKALFSRLHN